MIMATSYGEMKTQVIENNNEDANAICSDVFHVERADSDRHRVRSLHGRPVPAQSANNPMPRPGRHHLHLDHFTDCRRSLRCLPQTYGNSRNHSYGFTFHTYLHCFHFVIKLEWAIMNTIDWNSIAAFFPVFQLEFQLIDLRFVI